MISLFTRFEIHQLIMRQPVFMLIKTVVYSNGTIQYLYGFSSILNYSISMSHDDDGKLHSINFRIHLCSDILGLNAGYH